MKLRIFRLVGFAFISFIMVVEFQNCGKGDGLTLNNNASTVEPPCPNPGWETLPTIYCVNGQQHQEICSCLPPGYNDPTLWNNMGGGCYDHLTGKTCQ